MFEPEIRNQIVALATEEGVEAAALLALAEVESAGQAFAVVDGRREPIIRFEGHYFDRRLSGVKREQARLAELASPRAGAIRNPASQTARWQMLRRAAAIDRKAAYESTSWGLGQVMGAHWQWLGYASVEALAQECRSGAAGQARLMLRYLDRAGLKPALQARDWAALARGYNGPDFAKNRYDEKISAAYARHRRDAGKETAAARPAEPATPPATAPRVPERKRVPLLSWLHALISGQPA